MGESFAIGTDEFSQNYYIISLEILSLILFKGTKKKKRHHTCAVLGLTLWGIHIDNMVAMQLIA